MSMLMQIKNCADSAKVNPVLVEKGRQARGTGTPQNRVTESHILNEVAKTFAIHNWPVTAIKSYVGHSISVAAGDQLCASLGVWQYDWIPGIKTIDHIAEDVSHSNLHILMDHLSIQKDSLQAVIINSKGFGGNNASSLVLSPQQTLKMLNQRYGQQVLSSYMKKNEIVAIKVLPSPVRCSAILPSCNTMPPINCTSK